MSKFQVTSVDGPIRAHPRLRTQKAPRPEVQGHSAARPLQTAGEGIPTGQTALLEGYGTLSSAVVDRQRLQRVMKANILQKGLRLTG
jgi:hypothetical protein